MTRLRILVAAAGSHGDVLPFIALSRALQLRGHDVQLYASAYFGRHASQANVPFRAMGTETEYLERLRDPDLRHPVRGHRVIAAAIAEHLEDLHVALQAQVDPGRTIVIASVLAFSARLLQDTDRVPCVTVHLAPATLRSRTDTARMLPVDPVRRLPGWIKTLVWRGVDRFLVDRLYGAALNAYRERLRLHPIRGILDGWVNQAELVLALFPAWFAAPQRDWPANLQQTGFPLYDHGDHDSLAESVQQFLAAGSRPVVFTSGTAVASAQAFFAESVAACETSGRRGILITHRPEQLPRQLPDSVIHSPFAPFGSLLPRVAALVHHGGIGTTSQAIRAGVPQLISPLAYDQFDNSRRAQALGVAAEVLPRRYRSAVVNHALERLVSDPDVLEHCRGWSSKLAETDEIGRSCDVILRAVGHRGDRGGGPT